MWFAKGNQFQEFLLAKDVEELNSSISTFWKLKPKLKQLYHASKGTALGFWIKNCRHFQWLINTESRTSLIYRKACVAHTATSTRVQLKKH